ncbi:MAG: protease modulator HflC [Gammaproteobacteria bacterium]|jgi:membrane protease subunit HflC|nr:protease modulator HflC [Gammaproteobacteria bacterium]
MGQAKLLGSIVILALLVVGSFSMFTVHEREKAILFRLGEIVKTDFTPGLYFKMPFVNNVRTFDARIQTLDAEPERYLTSEKKNVIVDAFVKWRIGDVERYFTSTGGDPNTANSRLSQIIKDGLRGEFGKRTIQEVVSGERMEIMNILTEQANEQAKTFGIDLVDVRIKRIDLAKEISDSVYRRMEAERLRVAKDLRARGAEAAEIIRADADRRRTVLIAEAYREAQTIRGEGDGAAAKIYADAYNQDKEFYALYRSLSAYRKTFADKGDMLVLEPDSEFFKYFK